MPLTENEELWYKNQIKKYDPKGEYIVIDDSTGLITYTSKLKSDEKKIKEKNPEEYVHALILCIQPPHKDTGCGLKSTRSKTVEIQDVG